MKMDKEDIRFFYKPATLFLTLYNNPHLNVHQLSLKTKVTYSYAYIVVKSFITYGLITKKKVGRANKLVFTAKGKDLGELFARLSGFRSCKHLLNLGD